MITVSAVDDDQMLMDGLTAWLAGVLDVRLIGWAATVAGLLRTEPYPADVVLLEARLADGSDPVENVCALVLRRRRVLVVTAVSGGDLARRMIEAGAGGYLTKDHKLETLLSKVRELAREKTTVPGCVRPALSPQEHAVLIAYASGMTLTAAARSAGVRPGTAKNYLERVKEKYRKAGRPAYTKLELADRLREDGLAT
ncbi:MAG: response regulator transcription factor [Nonomuraea sp.]|nr:response regulator transcription factor [Nonomuraea sp.]